MAIIGVLSGKGGVGKSFVALNAALALKNFKRVLYVDFDANLSKVSVEMNFRPKFNVEDYYFSRCGLKDLVTWKQRLGFICGSSGSFHTFESSFAILECYKEIINFYASKFEVIIVDFPAGIHKENLEVLSFLSACWVVLNPEITSIVDAYSLIKIASLEFLIKDFFVITNKDRKNSFNGFSVLKKTCDQFLSVNLINFLSIPDSPMSVGKFKQQLAKNFDCYFEGFESVGEYFS